MPSSPQTLPSAGPSPDLATRCQAQQRFHRDLQDLLGGASSLRRPLRFAASLLGSPPSLAQCARVVESYRRFSAAVQPPSGPNPTTLNFVLPPYSGSNPHVRGIIDLLRNQALDQLHSAILHGSLASNEEIPYSDFDGLVVLSDRSLRDPAGLRRLMSVLREAQRRMCQLDPLQHHGWFALGEADLGFYPDDHLPHPVYEFSVSLSGQPERLALSPRPSTREFRASFTSASNGLRRRLSSDRSLANLYELKCTLSLFMLLPALYVQARDDRGIHKKFSFEAAASDFSETEWQPMRDASRLREEWPRVVPTAWCRLGERFPPLRRHLMHRFGPPIPPALRARVPRGLFTGMRQLADAMSLKLGLNSPDAAR